MSATVLIPKVGVVAFPQSMSGKDINDTVKSLHQKAVLKSVLKFVAKDPALVGLDTAEFYKQLSAIAAFLEKYTSLARAADAGIHGEKVHDLPTVTKTSRSPSSRRNLLRNPKRRRRRNNPQPSRNRKSPNHKRKSSPNPPSKM